MLLSSMLLLSITLVYAHGNFNETKKLIDSGISCDKLTNEQLEAIGDYYMEQMHPGETHEMMHKMMGGEDSETTKLMHVNMAKSIYCGETNQGMMGMMNMMMQGKGMMGNNMMNGNMMGNYPYLNTYSNIVATTTAILINILLIVLIAVIVVLLVKSLKTKK